MIGLRCAAVGLVVLAGACSVENPAFDPGRSSSATDSTAGDEAESSTEDSGQDGSSSTDGDVPDQPDCFMASLESTDTVFVVHDEAPTCDLPGVFGPSPCDVLAFGSFSTFPVFGLESTGDDLKPWEAGPAASYLLFHVEEDDVRGRDWEVIDATLRVDLEVGAEANGELQLRVMSSGDTNRWNRTTEGFGDPALPGETTFLHRGFPEQLWKDQDPVVSAADIPLGSQVVAGLGNDAMVQTVFIDLSPAFFTGFLSQPIEQSNGLMLTSTDSGPFAAVDAQSIVLEFEICEQT